MSHKTKGQKESTLHPGSSAEDAKKIGGKGDFGVPEKDIPERAYTSRNTKRSDPGNAPPMSSEQDSRTSGAGGYQSGAGSSSGGDLDADIVGVGTGAGVATSGTVHEAPGPDDATGTSSDFASGPPAQGKLPPRQNLKPKDTVQMPDDQTLRAQGADASANPQPHDDSFVGEISSDEASGRNDAG